MSSPNVKSDQLKIICSGASSLLENEETNLSQTASASGDKKKQNAKTHQTKAQKIIEENKQRKIDKSTVSENEQIKHVEDLLKQCPADDYSKAIDIINECLSNFKTPTNRLQLIKKKFHLQRLYLKILREKNILSTEEQSKLDFLQIDCFATMTEMAHIEKIVNVFDDKRKYLEELIDSSPLDHETWYRFQMEKINSRLPRLDKGLPDSRIPDFIPDDWQIEFLNAVDKRQSVVIIAPTASG